MNKAQLLIVGVVALILAAALVMTWDAGKDGKVDPTTETDGDDQFFQWPTVNDDQMGHVEIEHLGDSVIFTAVAEPGYEFVRWTMNGSFYSDSMSLEFPIDDVERIRAEFAILEGSVVVDVHWGLPVFDDTGVSGTVDQQFTMVLDSAAWDASIRDGDTPRSYTEQDPTPGCLVCDDVAVQAIVEHLEPLISGMTNLQRAVAIMYFVQDAIDYRTDSQLYGQREFWATPLETVYAGYGDCEDTAVLFVSIALQFGLDAGLVGFEALPMGHMSAAVALAPGEQVLNGSTFAVNGTTYVYVETAVDGDNVPLGAVPSAYSIEDGTWTHVEYDPESGMFFVSGTVPISDEPSSARYGDEVSYGDSFSDPPTIELQVGDTFTYTPTTSLPSEITASGSGMAGTFGGSFLTWDPVTETLSGTATVAGSYTVTLTATWTDGDLTQVAYQNIRFDVTDPAAGYVSQEKELVYAAGEWNVETVVTDPVDPNEGIPVLWIVAGAIAVVVLGTFVARCAA